MEKLSMVLVLFLLLVACTPQVKQFGILKAADGDGALSPVAVLALVILAGLVLMALAAINAARKG